MARLINDCLFRGLRGTIGKQVVFKQYADKVIVTVYPHMRKIKPTDLQVIYRNRLKEANEYARSIKRNWELRKQYEKNLKPGESVFHKAKKEFFDRYKKRAEF